MLCIEELLELEESLRGELNNHLEEILIMLYRFGHLKVLTPFTFRFRGAVRHYR